MVLSRTKRSFLDMIQQILNHSDSVVSFVDVYLVLGNFSNRVNFDIDVDLKISKLSCFLEFLYGN